MIISKLGKSAGFYSLFFFVITHYLIAKKYNMNFEIESSEWLFKYEKGWEDYFENIYISNFEKTTKHYLAHCQHYEDFPLIMYKNVLKDIYVYNNKTKQAIEEKKKTLNLTNYDAIFIRRGDKTSGGESKYIHSNQYIELLLRKSPNCTTIFLQTDDYNSYLELLKYIEDNNLNINLVTLCDKNSIGGKMISITNIIALKERYERNEIQDEYVKSVYNDLINSKSVDKMTPQQVYEHTIEMLIGIDIVLNSNVAIVEHSSNVSRFIKIAHNNSNNVFDVVNPDKAINWNYALCPSYAFEYLDKSA